MLLQNLHRRYLYIIIKLPHLSDLEQRIPDFLNCDNYGFLHASNPDPLLDDISTNDNELHQVICNTFKIDYFQEIDVIIKLQNRLECKINYTLPPLLPNKINTMQQGLATSGEGIRNKRAIPTLSIIQRIHRQYIRYESALDDTLIGIEHLNSGYLTHCILDPKTLA